ncbi:Coenzyme PQQ synthesis protein D (PqqD) [Butyrivibrio fibrisolvens DSM 3071]|uniref:Coenzyme PQQ synthesis protein D (PqqD) n=2 Tax=Butyrivibrio fibrisolvens TaxID=831 RepID=A0A1M5YN27_BUTFI|nr:Coenzyme PQQ synthesis protein D (PqqD) [Butyrivibrio fibrisolvens DSM 3071]
MMNKETKINLIKKIDVTDMAGDKVMIDFESGKYFLLRGTAVDIWDNIQKETTVGELVKTLLGIYEVDEETCLSGTEQFLSQLEEANFISLT